MKISYAFPAVFLIRIASLMALCWGCSSSLILPASGQVGLHPGSADPQFKSNGPTDGSILRLLIVNGSAWAGGTKVTGDSRRLARVEEDGSLNGAPFPEFRGGPLLRGPTGNYVDLAEVPALALQADGKVLAGGNFTYPSARIARLNPNGSLDSTFSPGTGPNGVARVNAWDPFGDLSEIKSIAVQRDGRILIAGAFDKYGSVTISNVARLFPSGNLDTNFHAVAIRSVAFVTVQPDDQIILAGGPAAEWGGPITRVDASGAPDPLFKPQTFYGKIAVVVVQPDGKLLVGGQFDTASDIGISNLIRLMPDGSWDRTFKPDPIDAAVSGMAFQKDGKIVIAGSFSNVGASSRKHLARLMNSGKLDSTFDPGAGADNNSSTVVIFPDARILLGGVFSMYDSQLSPLVARVLNNPQQFGSTWSVQGFQTSFRTMAGRTFSWQRRLKITDPWETVEEISGDGGVHGVSDAGGNANRGFYRVEMK